MRILMYSSYFHPHYSGAAKQALALAKGLRSRGHTIEFVTVRYTGLSAFETYQDFPIHRLEKGLGRKHAEWLLWWNLFKFTWRNHKRFDIFHSHGAYYTNAIIGPLSRLFGLKSIIKASLAENDLYAEKNNLSWKIQRYFLKTMNGCIAISEDLKAEFIQAGIAHEKIHFLPNAVDTERFKPCQPQQKQNLRKKLGLPEKKLLALTVGVFDERKNIAWLIDQWIKQKGFQNQAQLLAIGPQSREDTDGKIMNSIIEMAGQNKDLIKLFKEVDDIEDYYACADFFILPSLNEGMPNVILEAMASGLPCIASILSGTRDVLIEGLTGFSFETNDAKGLKQAVNAIASKPDMGRDCREFILDRYSMNKRVVQYELLYRSL